VTILEAIVHQQQNPRIGDAIGQQVEQRLGLAVDPMQVFENDHDWLLDALAQEDSLERVHCALALYLRVHLGQRVGTVRNCQQGE
jgi:hypothetical protein